MLRAMKRTGSNEVTLEWKHPADAFGMESYIVSVSFAYPSDDKTFLHEVIYQDLCIVVIDVQLLNSRRKQVRFNRGCQTTT
jgi:hypothetical protein